MLRRISAKPPSSGTALGLLALFVALGGVATGQTTPRATKAQSTPMATKAQTTPTTTTTPTPSAPADSVPVPEALHALQADEADEAKRATIDQITYVSKRKKLKDDVVEPEELQVIARCPDGMNVLGGGVTTTGADLGKELDFKVKFSGPRGKDRWIARVDADEPEDIGEIVEVTAICANVDRTHDER
jgi:hypothetical protein